MTEPLDLAEVRAWIGGIVGSAFSLELKKERAWATTLRVSVGDETAWFKACQPVQAFEPRLTADLARRWPDRTPRVLAFDERRAWLLTADAGASVGSIGNPPEVWLRALPRYAELQIGEAAHADEHLAHGVPDLRLARLPGELERLLASDVPLDPADALRLRHATGWFEAACEALVDAGFPETIQHDDLHVNGLFVRGEELRFLDWGDASVGQPFFSLVVTFRFLESHNGLGPRDRWFDRLRDAYLEPFGDAAGLRATFELAFRVGALAHCCAWRRHREVMASGGRAFFDPHYAELLRWATARALTGR